MEHHTAIIGRTKFYLYLIFLSLSLSLSLSLRVHTHLSPSPLLQALWAGRRVLLRTSGLTGTVKDVSVPKNAHKESLKQLILTVAMDAESREDEDEDAAEETEDDVGESKDGDGADKNTRVQDMGATVNIPAFQAVCWYVRTEDTRELERRDARVFACVDHA